MFSLVKLKTLSSTEETSRSWAHLHGKRFANPLANTSRQRRIYGHATDVAIRPLNEEKVVQAAADLLGELFVFSVAGVAVICEVQNRSRAENQEERNKGPDDEQTNSHHHAKVNGC
ncbi:unnamed protein product [Fraxinus pennsylvanica]|uniref:OPA3-like protein n=1 Tax=Fraxinus pennsylvanica TaxID=56036 RepID=A0AAD2ECL8_9LAMI|nr:unnamed protein product [Fraxinus pennsylvanica]